MPVGVEFYTPDGYRQLTDALRYWRLEQKSTLDASGWSSNGPWGGQGNLVVTRDLFVPGVAMSDFPTVALSSTNGTFATIAPASGGVTVTVFRVNRANPGPVTVYVFSRRRPVDPGFGMAIYDGSGPGGIIFSAMTPIIRPVGSFDNDGYTGLSLAGRQCAHIPQRRGRTTTRTFSVGGLGSCTYSGSSGTPTAGYQTRYRDREDVWLVSCSGSSVAVDGITYNPTSEVPLTCNPGFVGTPPPTYSQQPRYRSVVIDVTNY